jgi:hypothetical protein
VGRGAWGVGVWAWGVGRGAWAWGARREAKAKAQRQRQRAEGGDHRGPGTGTTGTGDGDGGRRAEGRDRHRGTATDYDRNNPRPATRRAGGPASDWISDLEFLVQLKPGCGCYSIPKPAQRAGYQQVPTGTALRCHGNQAPALIYDLLRRGSDMGILTYIGLVSDFDMAGICAAISGYHTAQTSS